MNIDIKKLRTIIQESVNKIIKEAAMPTFNLKELSKIPSFTGRVNYCRKELGNPIGGGSSRMVFQIDDNKVLKLAKNSKGIAQNEYEGTPDYFKESFGIFPEVFDKAEDDSWLVAEFVLPARESDFKQCFGMSFNDYCELLFWFQKWYRKNKWRSSKLSEDQAIEIIENNENLSNLNSFLSNYSDFSIGDLYTKSNYGLAMRDGKPYIVILDSGLNDDIYNKYYRRR